MLRMLPWLLVVSLLAGCAAATTSRMPIANADLDGDGVPGAEDKCPDSAPGIRVDAEGCAADSDGDGVFDYLDRCPGTGSGLPVDLAGCALDSDHDGVPDGRDACPDTVAAARIDSRGCAAVPKVAKRPASPSSELQVLFHTGSSRLLPGNGAEFERGLRFIRSHPGSRVIIEGHTDSVGPADYNRVLSARRAEVVRRELARRLGDAAPEMQAVGLGEEQPVDDNSTQQGRAHNRRVVVRIATK